MRMTALILPTYRAIMGNNLTKQEIKTASAKAQANMDATVRMFDGEKLGMWRRYWASKVFTPNKLRGQKEIGKPRRK